MDTKNINKPILMLTVGELMGIIASATGNASADTKPHVQDAHKKYVYGVSGLAKLLGCSTATAQRRLSSGILDECIIRTGRIIMIERDAALEKLKGGRL